MPSVADSEVTAGMIDQEEAALDALQVMLVDLAASFDELMHTGELDLLIQHQPNPSDILMRVSRLFPAVEYVQVHRPA